LPYRRAHGANEKYWVSAVQFRKHLACIRREGRRVAQLRELWRFSAASGRESPPIALTFDDGRGSDYEFAFPLLLEADIRAEFFVNTANVGTKGFLSWEQMSEMRRAGMSFQSHGHDHVDLARLPFREKERQLKLSKQILEARLGSEVEFIAVPYGRLSTELVGVAMQVGYRAVCTSRSWPTRLGGQLVNRVAVYAHTDHRTFKALLMGRPFIYAARLARTAMLFLPKFVFEHFFQPRAGATGLENVP